MSFLISGGGAATAQPTTASQSDSTTGTTADAYATVFDLDMSGWRSARIVVENTHSTNSLTAKVTTVVGGEELDETGEVALGPGDVLDASVTTDFTPADRVRLYVKSSVAGSPATYTAAYTLKLF